MTAHDDVDLLRRFEPIVRYTHGEYFFPMAVDPYIADCDLWAGTPDGAPTRLVPVGELSVETLPDWQTKVPDLSLFLRYVQEPMSGIELGRSDRPRRPRFVAPSRLARVGIVARLIDAGFDLSLLVRGTVPGGTVAAAEAKYARLRAIDPAFNYYGRVVRQAGWTVCHYLFFYAMNDWRSSFAGANDHEADWEQCFIFLDTADDGTVSPVWFARAAHDEVGADLRRRWDDQVLQREGDHPIIFAGAGSHAAYIEPGEYLQAVPLRLPGFARALIWSARALWTDTLRQGSTDDEAGDGDVAAVPFVDYARGDGLSIGPGQEGTWTPITIDDATPWVGGYDGLFGLDTKDRFAGERAPAGPKFNRNGRPRQLLDRPGRIRRFAVRPTAIPGGSHPPAGARGARGEHASLLARIAEGEEQAQRLGARVDALRRAGRSETVVAGAEAARARAVGELTDLRRQTEEVRVTIVDTDAELVRVGRDELGDPKAHLRYVARPQPQDEVRQSRILDVWSAAGVAAAMLLLASLLFFGVSWWWIAIPLIAFTYVGIEALVRRRFLILLLNISVLLAVVASFILIRLYFVEAIAGVILVIGFLILRDNMRELRASMRRD